LFEKKDRMIPLYQDPWFTFRFAENRIIPRFHLEGIEVGRQVSVFMIDPATGARLRLLATATVSEDGWVNLTEPIIVRAGEAFVAVPESGHLKRSPGRILVNAIGVAGLLAVVGFMCGLFQGEGNEFVLAVCFGAMGGFVVLLGYGPIGFLIAAFGAMAEWLHGKKDGSIRK
jgi:hypothetical protein